MSNTALNANRASGIVSAYQRTAGATNPFLPTGTPRVVNHTKMKVEINPDTTINTTGTVPSTAQFTIPRVGVMGSGYLKFKVTPKNATTLGVPTTTADTSALKIRDGALTVLRLFDRIEWRFNNKIFATVYPEQLFVDYINADVETRAAIEYLWRGTTTGTPLNAANTRSSGLVDGMADDVYWIAPNARVGVDSNTAVVVASEDFSFECILEVPSPFASLTNDFLDSNPLKGALTLNVVMEKWGTLEAVSKYSNAGVPTNAAFTANQDTTIYANFGGIFEPFGASSSVATAGVYNPITHGPTLDLTYHFDSFDMEDYVYRQKQASNDEEVVVKWFEPQFAPNNGGNVVTSGAAGSTVKVDLENIFGAAQSLTFFCMTRESYLEHDFSAMRPIRQYRITGNGREIVPWTTHADQVREHLQGSKTFKARGNKTNHYIYTAYFGLENNPRKALGAQSFGHGMNNAALEIVVDEDLSLKNYVIMTFANVYNTVSAEKGIIKNRLEE